MPFVFYLLGCPFLEATEVSCPEAGEGPQERVWMETHLSHYYPDTHMFLSEYFLSLLDFYNFFSFLQPLGSCGSENSC